jgi:hypothetical protein
MLKLPQTSLLIVVTRGHNISKVALDDILGKAEFKDVLIFTDQPDKVAISGARYFNVPDWNNKKDAGRFYYAEAAKHFETDFGLFMEWDAGIYDASKWQDAFLAYDYIGAPWNTRDEMKVGNGGFTIMSKRLGHFLCENRQTFPVYTDWDVCRTQRYKIEDANGFKWAPFDLAHEFSWELVNPRSPNTFGYHGIFNWPEMIGREETVRRAKLMMDDDYLSTKITPLLRKHPWVIEAISVEEWNQIKERRAVPFSHPRAELQRQQLLLAARRQQMALNSRLGLKA